LQTRKDLLQAHQLMTRRAALALLQAEPDPPDQPLRRLNVGALSSVLVAGIVAAVFGIWGLIAPGDAGGLTAPDTLLIDKATGAPFVPCQHGKLCPMLNYASARLALGVTTPNVREVTEASLARYPRGPEMGIPRLPPLPDRSMLIGQPWSVCEQTSRSTATLASHSVTTLVGGQRVGGRPMSRNDALVVAAGHNAWLLLWNGKRMFIPAENQKAVLHGALHLEENPEPVPTSWLNSFGRGSDFALPRISGLGRWEPGGPTGPGPIGQVFVPSSGQRTYYMRTQRGLTPITETEAQLLETIPHMPAQRTLSTTQVAKAYGNVSDDGLPPSLPRLVNGRVTASEPLCVVYSGQAAAGQVTVGGRVPSGGLATTGATTGATPVDQIAMKPGSAALVADAPAAGGQHPHLTTYFLVTGGVRYALASPGVAAVLGYDLARQRVLVPPSVVNLIPQGPVFAPAAARDRVSG
jgi:type VII secretion protein EccB